MQLSYDDGICSLLVLRLLCACIFVIELVRRQYSGNAHGIIKGIGVVTCVYVNPIENRFWIIDYRIFDPDGDGKTKLDHVADMLTTLVYHKQLPWRAVLMDT